DAAGNLYGTTNYGGDSDAGLIFKLDSSGGETILYSFRGEGDGGYPYAGVIRDSAGNLYGTTAFDYDGNCFCGTVWELTPWCGERRQNIAIALLGPLEGVLSVIACLCQSCRPSALESSMVCKIFHLDDT